MEYLIPHKGKMKTFFNQIAESRISKAEFDNAIDNFIGFGNYIHQEREGKPFIQEAATTEVDIGNQTFEVCVKFNTLYDNGMKTIIDLDYNHYIETT